MLKNRNEQIQSVVKIGDAIICVVAFFSAYWLRNQEYFTGYGRIHNLESLTWMLAASLALHFLIYPALGFYLSLRLKSLPEIILMVFRAMAVEFFILGSMVFFFQEKTMSRYFFTFFILTNYSIVLLERLGARVLLSSFRKRGYNVRQVLVVGTGKNAARVIQALKMNKHWGYISCGLLGDPESRGDSISEVDGIKVLGEFKDLDRIVHEQAVDEVYFALEHLDPSKIYEQVALCERLGIPARFSLSFFELPHSSVTFNTLDRLPIITFYTTLMTPAEAVMKRFMDIVVALIGLGITAVLYPWIAWRISRESPGPVIFKQVRVGENGRRFKCYKFRTMVMGADSLKADLGTSNFMKGPIFKLANDPRITKTGAWLRKTSLDELPQFFNILRGDMSVVGTRPPTPDEVSLYEIHFRRRLSIKPGLTGLWQVSGRNEINQFEDILALDLHYIDHWSIWLDIRIIFRTIWVTLFRRGGGVRGGNRPRLRLPLLQLITALTTAGMVPASSG